MLRTRDHGRRLQVTHGKKAVPTGGRHVFFRIFGSPCSVIQALSENEKESRNVQIEAGRGCMYEPLQTDVPRAPLRVEFNIMFAMGENRFV